MISEQMLPIAARIGAPLGNHLWQFTLFGGIAWLIALLLRNNRPSLRYALWTAASAKFLIPFSLFVGLGTILPKMLPVATEPHKSMYSALEIANQPFSELRAIGSLDRHPGSMKPHSALLPEFLFAVWLCGTITVLLLWYLRWRQVSSVLRTGEFANCGREVDILRGLESESKRRGQISVLRSREMMEPGIFGIFRPILLWPDQLTVRLDDEHVKAILAHELAHVRRRDNLTAALHMVVEAVFWFHPNGVVDGVADGARTRARLR